MKQWRTLEITVGGVVYLWKDTELAGSFPTRKITSKCSIAKTYSRDGSIDVDLETPIDLSGGEQFSRLLLKKDSTLAYYDFIKRAEYMHQRVAITFPEIFKIRWRFLYYAESHAATLAWLMCWQSEKNASFTLINKDACKMIGLLVYESYGETVWENK